MYQATDYAGVEEAAGFQPSGVSLCRFFNIVYAKEEVMSSRVRNISIEDLYRLRPVSKPRISPDGQHVAFVVTTIDERKYEYRSSIWVVSTGGGEAKNFTTLHNNSRNPKRAPDGFRLCVVAHRA